QTADRIFPTAARIGDKLGVGRGKRDIAVLLLERLVDLADLERDVLGLAQKLLCALDVLLELLERAMRQARKIAGLIDEHLRLVLEALNLVIDLLQSPGGREDVLRVVARVIDDAAETELRMGRACQHGRKRDGHGERQREGRGPDDLGIGHGRISCVGWVSSRAGAADSGRSARLVRFGISSAAQSTPRSRSHAARKPSRPASVTICAMRVWSDLADTAQSARPTSDRPSSNRRLPLRLWQ